MSMRGWNKPMIKFFPNSVYKNMNLHMDSLLLADSSFSMKDVYFNNYALRK